MFRSLHISRAGTLSQCVDEWLIHIKCLSPNTQTSYQKHIRDFQAKIDDKPLRKVTSKDFRLYLNEVFLKSRTKSSANVTWAVLKSFGRFIEDFYELPNPTEKIRAFKTPQKIRHFLNEDEYKWILEVCKPRQRDIIVTLAMTGLRASELCSLTKQNFDPSCRRLTVLGKGKVRVIPLNETVRAVLFKYPRDFTMYLPKNRKTLHKIIHRIGVRAGIHLYPHIFRHYFATQLLKNRVPIAHVAALLGDTISVCEKFYIHFQPDYLEGLTSVLD